MTVGLLLCRTGGWAVPAKLGQRLYEKSKLGRLDGDGNLVLSSEEVLFCHWNRHVSLPSEAWLEEELEGDPNLSNVLSFLTWLAPGGSSSSMTRHASLGPAVVPSCKATCPCRSRGRLVHGCSKRRLVDPPFGRSS